MSVTEPVGSLGTPKKRIYWVDIAKGIGIFLVSFGHLRNGDGQSVWLPGLDATINSIYLFHMPFFFFLGGLTFSYGRPFLSFLKRKVFTLLIPYYIFSIYFLIKPILVMVSPAVSSGLRSDHNYAIAHQLYDVLINGNGLWFLWAYFWGEMISYLVCRYLKKQSKLTGSVLIPAGLCLIILSTVLSNIPEFPTLPFRILSGIKVAGFIVMGLTAKEFFLGFQKRERKGSFALFLLFSLLFGTTAVAVSDANGLLKIVYSFVAMFLGVFAATFLSMFISRNRILEYIGKNSIVFYALNAFTLNIAKIIFFKVLSINGSAVPVVAQFIIGVVITVFSLVLLYGEDLFVRRFMRWSIGAQRTSGVISSRKGDMVS